MTHMADGRHRVSLALVIAGVVLFSLATTYLNWVKHISLRPTWSYDLALYHNTAFNLTQGRTIHYLLVDAFFSRWKHHERVWDEHEGPSIYRSTHFSPMRMLVFNQLYRLRPNIVTLFFLQSLIIALGALPLYLFGTQQTREPRLGLLLALSYLLHPVVLQMAFNDFRDIQLGVSFALFALWFHATRRPVPFVVAALLMLSCREEYLFLLALFGVINWRLISSQDRRLRWALAPLLLALLWAGVTNSYYVYFYGRPSPFPGHSGAALKGWTEFALGELQRLPGFLRTMLLPLAVGALIPDAIVVALLFMSRSDAGAWPAFPHSQLHQFSPAVAVIFWAFVCGVVRLWPWLTQNRQRRAWGQGALLAAALVGFAQFGWGAARAYLIGGFPRYEELTRINDALPADATVMAHWHVVARFSNHMRVFSQQGLPLGTGPARREPEIRAVLPEVIAVCDLVATGPEDGWIDALVVESGRFLAPQRVNRFHIFVAKADAPRPSNPDLRLQEILRWDQMSKTKRRWADILVRESGERLRGFGKDGHSPSP